MARPNRGVRAPPVLLLGPPGIGGRRSGAGEGLGPSSVLDLSWSSAMLPVLLVNCSRSSQACLGDSKRGHRLQR